nr:helix-hairpin-helix domain-containing protein [uncultured Roseateles sp.]
MLMLKKILIMLLALFAAATAFAAVDANRATQAELETIKGIGPSISSKILAERQKGAFKDWPDLVERVKGVGEGNAAKFSTEGLTVNGAAFAGAPAKASAAAPKAASTAKPAAKPAAAPAPAAASAPMTAEEKKAAAKQAKEDKKAAKAAAAEEAKRAKAAKAEAEKADKAAKAQAKADKADKAAKSAAAAAPAASAAAKK